MENNKYNYIGQCDKLRLNGYEDNWQNMMKQKIKITKNYFKKHTNYKIILDDDETLDNLKNYYPDIIFFKSLWANKPCLFIQHSGFEFIFTL